MLGSLPGSIISLSDEHIKEFSRCPYKFYMQDILKISPKLNEQQLLQLTINKIIKEFYKLPVGSKNSLSVLKLIDRYLCQITPGLFHTQLEYYSVVSRITDHLIKWLNEGVDEHPPLFLYEKQSKYIEELELNLSVCFEVVNWSAESYVIKKFVMEENEDFLYYFYSLLIVFAEKSFKRLPEKIEIHAVLSGKKYTFYPKEQDLYNSLDDLKLLKTLLNDPTNYVKAVNSSDCQECPLKSNCDNDSFDKPDRLLYI